MQNTRVYVGWNEKLSTPLLIGFLVNKTIILWSLFNPHVTSFSYPYNKYIKTFSVKPIKKNSKKRHLYFCEIRPIMHQLYLHVSTSRVNEIGIAEV